MTKMLCVHYDYNTENLGGLYPDDEWSRDSTRSSYYPTRLTIGENNYGDCPISDCKVGDEVYLVWADYITGDTFGSDSAVEFLAAFKHEGLARLCLDQAQMKTDKDINSWDIKVRLDEGEEYTVHIPWLGYFETLGELHITKLTVTE